MLPRASTALTTDADKKGRQIVDMAFWNIWNGVLEDNWADDIFWQSHVFEGKFNGDRAEILSRYSKITTSSRYLYTSLDCGIITQVFDDEKKKIVATLFSSSSFPWGVVDGCNLSARNCNHGV